MNRIKCKKVREDELDDLYCIVHLLEACLKFRKIKTMKSNRFTVA